MWVVISMLSLEAVFRIITCSVPQPGPTTIEQPNSISAQLNALIMKGKQSGETYGIK